MRHDARGSVVFEEMDDASACEECRVLSSSLFRLSMAETRVVDAVGARDAQRLLEFAAKVASAAQALSELAATVVNLQQRLVGVVAGAARAA